MRRILFVHLRKTGFTCVFHSLDLQKLLEYLQVICNSGICISLLGLLQSSTTGLRDGLNSRRLLSHRSGGYKSKNKMSAELVPLKVCEGQMCSSASLLSSGGLLAIFRVPRLLKCHHDVCLYLHMVSFPCACLHLEFPF